MELNVSDIEVGPRKRRLDTVKVAELAGSILEIGLLQPVTVRRVNSHYMLVAGAHRLEAFRIMKLPTIQAVEFAGDDLAAELAEIDENLRRSELTVLEQGEMLQRREEILTERDGRRTAGRYPANGETVSPLATTASIAAEAGLSERGAQQRKQIARDIPEDVRDAIRGTGMADSTTELLQLSRMEPDDQRRTVALLGSGSAKKVRDAARTVRNENMPAPKYPKGTYQLIYADPPWRYEHSVSDSREIENQYPTMELGEICAIPIIRVTDTDTVLFMWATSPKLAEAMQVIEAWGFTYKTCMVWVKDKIGMGYYARQQHELLLIATHGQPTTPEPADRPSSVVNAPRGQHSRKPEVFYELLERMYPRLNKLELFSRSHRAGWMAWGNQA